jgi:NADPH-dependent 2,4-dienoyl-CoA reductase/sulfur reductase-like enzyme/peroxiredoxin family protein/rhodanese-related sulfurtransferase/TusA-related sulfurtransferase
MNKKILIIGGVAGGATAAARLRRMDEFAEIIMFERGEYISFANCGLPYHIGGVIPSRDSLIVQSAEDMQKKFNIDIRIFSEVTSIDKTNQKVTVKNIQTGETYEETYDKLIISTGAQPIKPPLDGLLEASNVFTLRNIPDMDNIIKYIKEHKPKRAVVIGGGFIGIEVLENLHELGMRVTLVEMSNQVMTMFDFEMAQIIHQHIVDKGAGLILSDGVKAFSNEGKTITLTSGTILQTDMTILAIGVRPDNSLAKQAELNLTSRGAIEVNEHFLTSDPNIYAIGDVIDIPHFVTGKAQSVALAGPANKQARVVANHILDIEDHYAGTTATSAAKVFDKNVASTGINEKTLKQLGLSYKAIHLHPSSHASYYPGADPISMKVLFNPETEEIYGAQAIGGEGVDKRIDVLSTAIFAKMKVTDLRHLDLAYAPPFSSAKDPVNMVGFIAENIIKDRVSVITWQEMQELTHSGAFIADIRERAEHLIEHLPGSVNIPLSELRQRLDEFPKDQTIYVYCQVGTRGYTAARILMQHGFDVKNLDGGMKSYSCVYDHTGTEVCFSWVDDLGIPSQRPEEEKIELLRVDEQKVSLTLDACGLQCPGPIVKAYDTMSKLSDGDILEIKATDPGFSKDIVAWADKSGHTFMNLKQEGKIQIAYIQKGAKRFHKEGTHKVATQDGSTMVVFSQDLDKAIAALIIATGAKSMGKDVSLFFTFWGLNILRKHKKVKIKKGFMEKMFAGMMPRGTKKLPISNMNMMGIGPNMIRSIMKKKNVDSLEVLLERALEMGVKMTACAMSMDIMGIKEEELIDGIEIGGVATYLADSDDAHHHLFI